MQLNRRTFTTGVVAASAAVPSIRAVAQSTPEATPVSGGDFDAKVQAILDKYGVPGAVIAVSTADMPEPITRTYGVANLETGAAMSPDLHFRIASVTKTFVATVMLQLVDEGLVTLDDTVSMHLPDLQVANAETATIRDLLSMRSGFALLTDSPEYQELFVLSPTQEATFAEYAGLMADLPAHAEPDTEWEYNNFNYDTLGEIIKVVTGDSWDVNVATRITEPLGMVNTMMTNTPDMPEPYATGYGYLDQEWSAATTSATPEVAATPAATPAVDPMATPEGSVPVNDDGAYDLTMFNPTIAGAAGGLISTIGDLMLWAPALGSGELISPEMHTAQIEGDPTAEGSNLLYGLGVMNAGGIILHNGAINGYQSAVASSPEAGLSIAILTNCHPTIGFGDAAIELLLALAS